jgi:hypothetical protein
MSLTAGLDLVNKEHCPPFPVIMSRRFGRAAEDDRFRAYRRVRAAEA